MHNRRVLVAVAGRGWAVPCLALPCRSGRAGLGRSADDRVGYELLSGVLLAFNWAEDGKAGRGGGGGALTAKSAASENPFLEPRLTVDPD